VLIPTQNRGEVKAKPVDMHVHNPVAEYVHDELSYDGMVCVKRIPDAGEVLVVSAAVLLQHVEDRILDSTQADRRSQFIPFRCVIQHNVENHFDAGAMKCLDHLSELYRLVSWCASNAVGLLRSVKGNRVVSPIIPEPLLGQWVESDQFVLVDSATGISSIAVTPRSFRYGIFSVKERKVPG
jgi:hypothetical protein